MPEPKHQCGSCRFFQNAQLTGNGWCTHPARQPVSDVKILVRERELACRNVWGDDLWSNSLLPATTFSDPEIPRRPFLRLDVHLEDEITSVTDASFHTSLSPENDDVVTVTSVRSDDALVTNLANNDVNLPAVDDQAERARMMARGNGPAIRSARERHVQRRTTSGNTASEPDTESQDDVVLATSETQTNAEPHQSIEDQTAVAAKSAVAPTHRFAIDHVDSDVGLPRLRSFLLVEQEEQAPDAVDQAPDWTSQFDHVFRQAERIKERTRVSQQANATPIPVVSINTSNESPSESNSSEGADIEHLGVVWDVNPSEINAEFSRALPADGQDSQTVVAESISLDIIEPNLNRAVDIHTQPIPIANLGAAVDVLETEAAAEEIAEIPYASLYDDEWIEDSPKGSWWRSLNFGLPRRLRGPQSTITDSTNENLSHPDEPVEYYSDEEAPTEWLNTDFALLGEAPLQTAVEANADPEVLYSAAYDSTDQWEDDSEADSPFELNTPTVNQYITSEENWMLDVREFPAPQPSEWHDYRAALLASLPPIEYLDDAVEWIAATPQSTPIEPLPAVRPLPDPKSFIDVHAPGGMDAFLSALFQRANRPTDHFMAPIELWSPATESASDHSRLSQRSPVQSNAASVQTLERSGRPTTERPTRRASAPVERENLSPPRHSRAEDTQAPQPYSRHQDRRESRPPATRAERTTYQLDPPVPREDLAQVRLARPDGSTVKCCLTCRSYAPSNERGRGRCTNEWSKTNRAIVEADDLACHSSLGDWWFAADATWIPPESAIRPQTPRTEELLNDLDDQQSQRGPASMSKRVRTSNVG